MLDARAVGVVKKNRKTEHSIIEYNRNVSQEKCKLK